MNWLKVYTLTLLVVFVLAACNTHDMDDTRQQLSIGEIENGEIVTNKSGVQTANLGEEFGLFIPSYVHGVNSIDELNAHKNLFESEIIGVKSNSDLIHLTKEVLDDYDLEYRLIPSTEQVLLEELDNYINHHQQPILVALWKSHDAVDNLNLKMLKDPLNIYRNSTKMAQSNEKAK